MAEHPNPLNDSEKVPLREYLDTRGIELQPSTKSFVKLCAEERAKITNRVVTVYTDTGVEHTAAPPGGGKNRPTNVTKEATGEKLTDETRTPEPTIGSSSNLAEIANTGQNAPDDGDISVELPGFKDVAAAFKSGPARLLGGILPSMEAIMLNIPSNLLGKFTQGLPAGFQSLLPAGALGGIVGAVVNTAIGGGTTSLNNLVKTVAGVAVGAAAGQALRSVTGGIGIPAVSGLAGSLGAIALNSVARASTAAVPLNLASNLNPRATFGNTPQSSAVLATVAGTVGAAAFRGATQGIPVSSSLLGLSANVALNSIGSQLNIPTPVLGLASNFASGAISSIVGGLVGSRVPVLSSNLSLPLTGALSGIAQSISANVAQTLIPSNVLQGLLPPNLQNAIPRVPPRINSPYIANKVGVNRGQAQEVYPPGGPRTPQEERKSTLGALQGPRLIGTERLSEHYTVDDMSTLPRYEKLTVIRGNTSLSIAQIYENMKFTAENVLERMRQQFPGFYINSGLRNENSNSWHTKGCAVDLQWNNPNFATMAEKANWVYNNIPALREVLLESKGPSNGSGSFWLHIAVVKGQGPKPERAGTWYVNSGKKIPYNNGFIKGA